MTNRLSSQLLSIIFIGLILSSSIGWILGINSITDNTEYRRLSTTPYVKDAPLSTLPKNFTEYFNDNFGLRNVFIKFYGFIKLNIFNTHPLYSSILGKQGWIFMNPVVFPSVDKWHVHETFSEVELKEITTYLEGENEWLKERNIPYILLIIPYKEQVYPEFYPYPNHIVSKPIYDQFINYMKSHTNLPIIDLRKPLTQAKLLYPVYYHTDSHWNQWGAYIGYQEIGKVFAPLNPGFHPYQTSEFTLTPQYYHRWIGDLMRTSAVWKERVPDVNVTMKLKPEISDQYPKLNSIFVYGDSFAQTRHLAIKEDFLTNFPELADRLDLIFAPPFNSNELRIKAPIDELVPKLEKYLNDPKLSKRVERYLVNFRLQDDELLGINYFLGLNFENIYFEQRQHPLEKELIEKERPQLVVRELIEQVLYSSFDELLQSSGQQLSQ